ncbi:DUF6273 domain-containing protein [uncultured Oscillibacter sp.]|uniref:DUF6273 domain-containing protein n=1 Tax=uncultured Oscillibacter sp. TaxID=876091 RepID=UPI0025F671FF|nr:DUF6273 domain-containing protein [uncultured Oscillibacter sp.]
MAKGTYIGVGGAARKVKDSYIGVNGVARKIKTGYVDVSGVARKFYPGGTPLGSLPVGAIVQIKEKDIPKEYIVVHQGLPSAMYDASCNGTWLFRKFSPGSSAWASSEGFNQYADSWIHSYLNSSQLALFHSSVQSRIKQIKLPYGAGAATATVYSGANGLSTKLFIPALYEVGLTNKDSYATAAVIDGACWAYFSGNFARRRILTEANRQTDWWLRTPSSVSGRLVYFVYTSCDPGTQQAHKGINGYPFAMVLPSDATVEELAV